MKEKSGRAKAFEKFGTKPLSIMVFSWSEAVNITSQTHRPKQPQINPAYNFSEDWRSYANTPGHAMQFSAGLYKGRMYVAANHSAGDPQAQFVDYKAHGFYTDDHGKSFHLSENIEYSWW